MKILGAEYNQAGDIAVVSVGDDVLLRNNGDFYVPEFTQQVSCVPQLVVRICKLGKSIGERFAGRYFEEIGVGIRFYADTFEEQLQKQELPAIMAASFDSSFAIGRLVKAEQEKKAEYVMTVNGVTVTSGSRKSLPVNIEKLIAFSSEFHTLKIGDYLFCGHPFRYREIKPGDRLQLMLDGVKMLDFVIR